MNLPLGYAYSATYAGIRQVEKDDLALIVTGLAANGAAVFTQNRVQAAPVKLCRRHLRISGGLVGAVSAYFGGWVDEITQRFVEIILAFPFLLAALTLSLVLAQSLHNSFLAAMIAVIAFSWPYYTRLIRGDVLAVKQRDYVLAA